MPGILIIGGGPAGLTAGLYAARGGADAALCEELFCGGQAAKTERIDNFPGFPEGIDGFEVGGRLEKQATRFGLKIEYAGVEKLELVGTQKRAILTDGRTLTAKAVILCMGATPRKLGLPEEARFEGRGVSYCATCDGAFFRGKDVAVIGGGDTAVSDALYLARICSSVTVVHRRDKLRASAALGNAARAESNIRFAWDSVVTAIHGEDALTGLTLNNVKTGDETTLSVSGAFVAVGILPRTELVAEALGLAQGAPIPTDAHMRTSIPGVFAAGDVRDTPLRQAVTACSDGAVAATAALAYLLE